MNTMGKVTLLGAGPGDLDLLTLKAAKALAAADVLLLDDLVNPDIVALAPQARVIRVGKRGGCRSTPQTFIERLMCRYALRGAHVVRVKGGDVLLFGRAGEEIAALRAARVPVEIVNGISSGFAAAASLGVSLTHRDHCQGVTFVTAHLQDHGEPDWARLAAAGTTLAIYMGMSRIERIAAGLLSTLDAATPDAPERRRLRIGFVALSDAAPLVVAKRLELGERYGLALELCRQPSWASIRDKLLSGELDAAHALYGLVYGVQLGIGGPRADMAVPMVLNRNGQAITFSNRLAGAYRASGDLKAALATLGRRPVFAQTFPTGTHAMWLYHWLASRGVDPLRDIRSVVIPPPEMVGALAAGELDGLCVGEPWNAVAEASGAGRTVAATSEVWLDHPEKALACRREFVALYPNAARLLVRTLLDACEWLDDADHRRQAAEWLAEPDAIDVPVAQIAPRLLGDYGAGPFAQPPAPIRFYGHGTVNRPAASDGVWFLSQYRRWGMLRSDVDDAAIASGVAQTALYDEAVALAGARRVG